MYGDHTVRKAAHTCIAYGACNFALLYTFRVKGVQSALSVGIHYATLTSTDYAGSTAPVNNFPDPA